MNTECSSLFIPRGYVHMPRKKRFPVASTLPDGSEKYRAFGETMITTTNNGKADVYLPGVDGRTVTARRFKELYQQIIEDAGGDQFVTENVRQLARRAAFLSQIAEAMERDYITGGDVSIEKYMDLSKVLARMIAALGTDRKQRRVDAAPSLNHYLEGKSVRE